jgi:hypothetical protein
MKFIVCMEEKNLCYHFNFLGKNVSFYDDRVDSTLKCIPNVKMLKNWNFIFELSKLCKNSVSQFVYQGSVKTSTQLVTDWLYLVMMILCCSLNNNIQFKSDQKFL